MGRLIFQEIHYRPFSGFHVKWKSDLFKGTRGGVAYGTTHSSSSKMHAPPEVEKGYRVGYIKAKINLHWSKPQNSL